MIQPIVPSIRNRLAAIAVVLVLVLVSALVLVGPMDVNAGNPASRATSPQASWALAELPPLAPQAIAMMQTNVLGPLESRIFFVTQWELSKLEKAQVLFAMLPPAAPDDQRKLAHAAVSFVANSNFAAVSKHLLNPALPKPVLSALMSDTLKRSYDIKLPMILALAQLEPHPLKAEARELLQGYLGRDHGTNWGQWAESITARLDSGSAYRP